MEISTSKYIKSAGREKDCPVTDLPEFAFTGRSNVGKSSLINMLCIRKDLARTSANPGKTQSINHFLINDQWFLVDLPGYGYARVSKTERNRFQSLVTEYIYTRKNLMLVFVLIDSRITPQKTDLDFINWLGKNGIPLCLIFTKSDKLKNDESQHQFLQEYQKILSDTWETFPPCFFTSSRTKLGRDNVLDYIDQILFSLKK